MIVGGFEWQLMKDHILFIDKETGEMRTAEELYRSWCQRLSGNFNPIEGLH